MSARYIAVWQTFTYAYPGASTATFSPAAVLPPVHYYTNALTLRMLLAAAAPRGNVAPPRPRADITADADGRRAASWRGAVCQNTGVFRLLSRLVFCCSAAYRLCLKPPVPFCTPHTAAFHAV